MGIKLIILLALLIGVLYCIHLLVKDYQALQAPKLLRMLFKRDVNLQKTRPNVRWRKILQHDTIQCTRLLFCDLGVRPPDTEVRRGFVFMLTLNPHEEDSSSQTEFQKAYRFGKLGEENCRREYPMCPFKASLLFELVQYLLHTNV
ncbi:uncharacterized protein LOC113226988 isoform X2 [Hyposmocoma kahamanoa]|uniref:uncharacterized protein LOC113226988 isoform X2 n=1 Tax=Hyposmocoma kahamanoa TaxID=1477025 RepID=UPI000E6D5FF4|nr:uncharacterized protein LOC113226988 isoform X2 [Hyposmocoma kahamanoa]